MAGISTSCMFIPEYGIIPISGLLVVMGYWLISGDAFVNTEIKDDFPEFAKPTITACMSSFFIPCLDDFPDFLVFSCLPIFSFSLIYLVLRFASIFSEDLCFG